ncbi:MAG: hypothetical protein ABIO67_05570 [Mycobacteriales bacterium]
MTPSTLAQRLYALDNRVFRMDKPYSADRWRQMMARWWIYYLVAFSLALIAAAMSLNGHAFGWALVGPAIGCAYTAGWRQAEHDRVLRREHGRGSLAWTTRRRPAEFN